MPRISHAAASAELAGRDPVIAALYERVGPCRLRPRRGSSFQALTRAIVYQQLSGRAAETIYGRFVAVLDGAVEPEAVLATPVETLRTAGLSNAKAASLLDLAAKLADGSVPLDDAARCTDDELIDRLVAVRGIGRWTAEMFLMFHLRRLDVWPVDDLGVRKGYASAWGLAEVPKPKVLADLGDTFRPFRSVAAWYCWRAVEDQSLDL